ncbi:MULTISPECIES: CHAT domain-containing protein [unclassified Coleofasciculus]|uniref:CHAT domain-containing protein n=1 Tax=unclassified Coleofasciculus TaxID=2692782 RepID=UPI00187FC971|nr:MULTISPECIES: tetratricopeptide repeat protein [unclassified Coleofasciculus]MBE9124829.1 tetratricopeptide repeat protein [Coleofasciculus sp. LEGE 07081]MBE9147734.1 tetratricopeptide repeat protein [Coleofasciculus sp. LEGE 07092]
MNKILLRVGTALIVLMTAGIASSDAQTRLDRGNVNRRTLSLETLTAQASPLDQLWQQASERRGQGQYEEAIAILDQILQLEPNSFLAWYWRGNSFSSLGQYEEAIASYTEAVQVKPDYLVAWFEQGNAFEQLQQYEEAIAAWQQVLSLQSTSEYEQQLIRTTLPVRIASVLLYDLQRYEEAIALYNPILLVESDTATHWIDRGTAFYQLEQYQSAIADYDRAIELDETNALAWKRRGFTLYRLERYDEAIVSFETAEQLEPDDLEVAGLLEILKTVQDSRAELRILQQRFANLNQLLSDAEERLMNIRAETQAATEQLQTTQEELRQSQQRLAAIQKEIAAAEKRLDTLQAEASQSQQQLTVAQEERQIVETQLETLQAERQRLEQTVAEGLRVPELPSMGAGVEAFQEELQTLQQVGQREIGLTNDFEEYLGFSNIPIKPLSVILSDLRQIQQSTGAEPAIVYSFFGSNTSASGSKSANKQAQSQNPAETEDDPLELVVITADGRTLRKEIEGATREQIREMTQEFFRNVTNVRNPEGYLEPAQKLYEWLVAPLEETFQGQKIDNLTFLMDKSLRSVPIAALHDGTGFLAERYSLGIMPSLALTDTTPGNLRNAQVLAMGADNFPDQRPLPAVPVELEAIAARLWSGESYLNEKFTLENLKQARNREPFGLVHLATHAEFQPGKVSNSYIELWGGQKLRLDQLRQMELDKPPVELLVLSACRTALGNEEAELGFAGLAVQAGVKSAMGSLWYVSDEGTLALMTAFYKKLKDVPIKAEALRQAQVAMIRGDVRIEGGQLVVEDERFPLPPKLAQLSDRTFAHPYYWSAFTIIGNPW